MPICLVIQTLIPHPNYNLYVVEVVILWNIYFTGTMVVVEQCVMFLNRSVLQKCCLYFAGILMCHGLTPKHGRVRTQDEKQGAELVKSSTKYRPHIPRSFVVVAIVMVKLYKKKTYQTVL